MKKFALSICAILFVAGCAHNTPKEPAAAQGCGCQKGKMHHHHIHGDHAHHNHAMPNDEAHKHVKAGTAIPKDKAHSNVKPGDKIPCDATHKKAGLCNAK